MLFFKARILKLLFIVANREDPHQIAFSEAVCSGNALFGRQLMFENLEHLPQNEIK